MTREKIEKIIDEINEISKIIRGKYFHRFIKLLSKMQFSSNSISVLRIICGILFFALIKYYFTLAFVILVIGLISDLFDGALARYQNTASDRGKFIDMIADNIIFSFFVLGLISINFGDLLALAYFLFSLPLLYLIISVNKNEMEKSDWIINPIARISYYKFFFELFVVFKLLGMTSSRFDFFIIVLNILISLHIAYQLFIFINKKDYKKIL